MDGLFEQLVSKLSKTIEEAVRSAVSALKTSFENEIEHLTKKVDNLTARVVELEKSQHSTTIARSSEQQVEINHL